MLYKILCLSNKIKICLSSNFCHAFDMVLTIPTNISKYIDFTSLISFTPFTGYIGKITPFFKSQPICFKFSGITLDDMRNHYKAFYENLLVRILLKSVFVEKNAFFTKKSPFRRYFSKTQFFKCDFVS